MNDSDSGAFPVPKTIGRYTLERELGRGASSSVYLATDGFEGRQVAMKVLWRSGAAGDLLAGRDRALFLNEASLVGRLEHPHIVALLDAAMDPDFSYVVMEYIPGGTLERHTTPDNLLPLEKVIEIVYKVSRALDYAHRHGVIHRDIKPANILLVSGTDVKVSDFGVAQLDSATHTSLDLVGSPAYSSPEQIEGRELRMQTDMWSLGVVTYQMLAGRLPFIASSYAALLYQIANVDPAPLGTLRPDLPPGVLALIDRALQKDVKQRFADWNEFSAEIANLLHETRAPGPEELSEARKFHAMSELTFFRDFREVEIWEVLRASGWKEFPDGSLVIREGERGDAFYVLVDGCVEVSRGGNALATLVAGACFGEMLYFEENQILRTTTVRASGTAVALEIPAATLAATSDACQVQFNRAFLRILLGRLEGANRRLAGG
jgi:tRNA A-37 threonylcarbamoyl transferase component Bud32